MYTFFRFAYVSTTLIKHLSDNDHILTGPAPDLNLSAINSSIRSGILELELISLLRSFNCEVKSSLLATKEIGKISHLGYALPMVKC